VTPTDRDPAAEVGGPVVVTVHGICVQDGGLLLVRYGHGPAGGHWDLPATEVWAGEALAEALVRACEDLTGCAVLCGPFIGWSEDPTGSPPSVALTFEAVPVNLGTERPRAGGGATEARFWPVEEVIDLRLAAGTAELLSEHGVIDAVA
jgi:ADP-ribose pyrophosphatase YjhB (NUDIX family)